MHSRRPCRGDCKRTRESCCSRSSVKKYRSALGRARLWMTTERTPRGSCNDTAVIEILISFSPSAPIKTGGWLRASCLGSSARLYKGLQLVSLKGKSTAEAEIEVVAGAYPVKLKDRQGLCIPHGSPWRVKNVVDVIGDARRQQKPPSGG